MIEIKGMWVDEPDILLENYQPDNGCEFGFWINFRVGLAAERGGDIYRVLVCTPDWIKANLAWEPIWGRHMLIMPRFDFMKIQEKLNELVCAYSDDGWSSAAGKLSRFAEWEFEDYVP